MKAQVEGAFQSLPEWSWSLIGALLIFALFAFFRSRRTKGALLAQTSFHGRGGRRRAVPTKEDLERRKERRREIAGQAALIVGVMATGLAMSVNTSMRFAELKLHMEGDWKLGAGLLLEAAVLGLSIYSWAVRDAGPARVAMFLVGAQAIGAYEVARAEGSDLGATAVRLVGPAMLAYSLHKLLKLEAKLNARRLEISDDGRLKKLWNKAMANLDAVAGIATEEDLDAEKIARRRAIDKAAKLATVGDGKVAKLLRRKRRLQKLTRRIFRGLDAFDRLDAETELVDQIDRMNSVDGLRNRTATWSWTGSLGTSAGAHPAPASSGEAPDAHPDPSALTSGGTAHPDPGSGSGTPGANGGGVRVESGDVTKNTALIRSAFELYHELGRPSGNAFVEAWKQHAKDGKEGYPGMKTDRVRDLHRYIDTNTKKSQ